MMRLNTTPTNDGYHMPAEYAPHEGTIMIWPERPGSWPYEAKAARIAFEEIIKTCTYKKWFFGKCHIDKNIPVKFYAVFNNVTPLK